MKVEELELALNSDTGWLQPIGVAVYDWSEDQWLELQNQSMGTNIISSAGKLVSPGADGGLVRVQLSSDSGGGGCYYVEMGFSGTR